jgi:hypothetical protein
MDTENSSELAKKPRKSSKSGKSTIGRVCSFYLNLNDIEALTAISVTQGVSKGAVIRDLLRMYGTVQK